MDLSPQQTLIDKLQDQGIKQPKVLQAIANTPRELFVPKAYANLAYEDEALPIDCSQTISQPFVVARMTETILGKKNRNVLEIGTGSGYQATILAQLFEEVYTIERIKILLDQAKKAFNELGLTNVHTLHGDGQNGWPDHAPYDAIIVTAAASSVPQALPAQLEEQGRMIIPVNDEAGTQTLQLIIRNGPNYDTLYLDPVMFVPLVGGIK